MKLPIYLDNHATTPLDPRVLEAMLPLFKDEFGNAASSDHPFGWKAEKKTDSARAQVARLIGAEAQEIIFTSGTTEANNLVLKGVVEMYRDKGNHIITQNTEHKSVLDPCHYLEEHGVRVTYLAADSTGLIRMDDLKAAVTDKTILISVMIANNEIGTIQPIAEIGRLAKERGILLHCDGAQAVGKIPVHVDIKGIDLLSFSGHKMYGPKGIGALYVRRKGPRVRLAPQIHGGGHERGLRSGTLNTPGIVGLGKACEIAEKEMPEEQKRIQALRDRLHTSISEKLEDVYLNGHPSERLPNNLNLSFLGVEGESLLMGLNEEIAVSAGSACMSSAATETSYVLKALGLTRDLLHASIRFGLGRFNTEEEIDFTAKRVIEVVQRLRDTSPFQQSAGSKNT